MSRSSDSSDDHPRQFAPVDEEREESDRACGRAHDPASPTPSAPSCRPKSALPNARAQTQRLGLNDSAGSVADAQRARIQRAAADCRVGPDSAVVKGARSPAKGPVPSRVPSANDLAAITRNITQQVSLSEAKQMLFSHSRTGLLWKRGFYFLRRWQWRRVTLHGRLLCYFKIGHDQGEPRGALELTPRTTIEELPANSSPGYGFKILPGDTNHPVWELAAASPEERVRDAPPPLASLATHTPSPLPPSAGRRCGWLR